MPLPEEKTPDSFPDFLSGGGELGELIRAFDWSSTSLGPVQQWPHSLRTCMRIMLTSRQPIWIGWGRELIKLYNDPYKAIVGGKHPWALGKPASVVWRDIWREIEPMLRQVMEQDTGTYVESQLLIMERNGYPEETYYTFSYTPIPGDDGGTAGMICANTDDTDRIISERQLLTLTRLGKRLTDSQHNEEVVQKTLSALAENQHDFPFAIFYIANQTEASFAGATVPAGLIDRLPKTLHEDGDDALSLAVRNASATRTLQVVEHASETWGKLPAGAWPIAPVRLAVLPVDQAGKEPYGYIVFGLNPYRLPDEKYVGFFSLIADQVATSFADVHLLEEERKRAEALAELDRAKTTFFSNISHEFRTPLTLMLGPIEDAINEGLNSSENQTRLDTAYRNGLRLQKLVNTLLEFSRIEAGRLNGSFSRVDIATYTRDLASTFQSAIEKAGMELRFDIEPIAADIYVDPEMWERIILNLVSNAFKYSNDGSITVKVKPDGNGVAVAVADSGIGIAPEELDKVFDRFHRIESRGGRSQEGTGIGLAMVRELVRLHGGNIYVKSEFGNGSEFTIILPAGNAHLPADRLIEKAYTPGTQEKSYVQEALKWAEDRQDTASTEPASVGGEKRTVLLADDNADMREYVRRLLDGPFRVLTARDGEEALAILEAEAPDLLLTDVMMPRMDGFTLLKHVRNHPERKNTPVIFLSARAGEEAKVEGLDAGADDYLVKPFSARELLARVEGNIRLAESRKVAEQNLRLVIQQAPVAMTILRGPKLVIELANERALELWGKPGPDVLSRPAMDAFPELVPQGFNAILQDVYQNAKAFRANEMPVELTRYGQTETLFINFIYEPLRAFSGGVDGIIGVGIDVTAQVRARQRLEQNEQYLEAEVARRTSELEALNNDLQQSNNDLQQFAHVASHDLKEPLRKVKTFASRLVDDPGTHFSEKGSAYLAKVNSAADRMYTMIEGVLHYSVLNALGQETGPVDLGDTLAQIHQDLELPIAQQKATIHYEKLPVLNGASVLLYQLIYNLVNNSLKFVHPGRAPRILIRTEATTIDGQEGVEIHFSDNGIGFDPLQSERIFNTFTRLNPKDRYEGTGLGLSLCRRIVQRHGGQIRAIGRPDEGAEFIISLPLQQGNRLL
jgi:signal transduction histidine kinase